MCPDHTSKGKGLVTFATFLRIRKDGYKGLHLIIVYGTIVLFPYHTPREVDLIIRTVRVIRKKFCRTTYIGLRELLL